MPDAHSEIVVVGAGIVGLCVAHALAAEGRRVRVVDPEPPGSQCSYGNSGALSAGSVAPLAMPGVVQSSLAMLADSTSPLFIPAGYWLKAAPWLWRFVRASRPERVQEIARGLHGLLSNAVALHRAIALDVGCGSLIRSNGQLHMYPDDAAMAADHAGWRLKAEHGLKMERVDAGQIHALEPAVRNDIYRVAYFLPEEGSVVSPPAYALAIASALRERQVVFERTAVQALGRTAEGWSLRCTDRNLLASQVVICAGAWSARLLTPLGLKVPLQTQRGYHLQYPEIRDILSRVIVLADRKVFLNPMPEGLRIGGTVEIDAIERPARPARAAQLETHLKAGLRLPESLGQPLVWMGHRPCFPDSMPALGAVPQWPGLWCAFGHGHLGLTGAARTGQWLAKVVAGQPAPAAMTPFSIQRFQ